MRPVQTRFPFGFRYNPLTLLDIVTRRLIIQKARRHPERINGLRQLGSARFQVYFTPLHGVLFTFPSRYWFTIGHQQYLALRDGPRGFRRGCTCPVVLRKSTGSQLVFIYRTITLYGVSFQTLRLTNCFVTSLLSLLQPPTPRGA
jgi:hypothetical protein